MTGDCHVRFCKSRGVRFPSATYLALDSAGNIFVANVDNTITEYRPPAPSSYASPDNSAPILTIPIGPGAPEGLAIPAPPCTPRPTTT